MAFWYIFENVLQLIMPVKDIFESKHSEEKEIRQAKRSSVNPLYTMISNDERKSVYNLSSGLISNRIEKTMKNNVCSEKIVQDYLKTLKNVKNLYECSTCSFYGTEYKSGLFVLLPESTNALPAFAKIFKVYCCEDFCHLYYQKTSNSYCSLTDLFMIKDIDSFGVVRSDHLADYHVLHGYEVGEDNTISISLRCYIAEHL